MELRLILDSRNSVFQVPIPTKFLEKLTERIQIYEPRSDYLLFVLLCFVQRVVEKATEELVFFEKDNKGIRDLATLQLGVQSQILQDKGRDGKED